MLEPADLTPQQITDSWRTFDCDYASCKQTINHRCRTASGALAAVHANRRVKMAAWLSRQPEVDALNALVLSLRASNDQLTAALTVSDDKVTMALQRITNLQGDLTDAQTALAAAQQELADYKASHPDVPVPPVQTTRFGMSVSPGDSFTRPASKETAAQQTTRIVATYGALDAAKCFYTGNLPATFNTAYEGTIPGKVAAVCFKPNQDALANGSLDAAITKYVASIPKGFKVLLVNWQEPDDEMWKDHTMTVAGHRAATDHLCDVVHAADPSRERAEVWDIYMGFSLDVGRFDAGAVSRKLDGLGWDYYWNSASSAAKDPLVPLKKMADQTKALGIGQWGLFETGDNPDTFKDGTARAGFWTKVYDGTEALGYRYCLYFNALGTTGDHRIIPGQPYSDPMVALLKTRM